MGLKTTTDIGMLLHKCRNRVKLVGIELEGGWHEKPPCGGAVIRDGSVRLDPSQDVINAANAITAQQAVLAHYTKTRPLHIGELPSQPMQVKDMDEWIVANYPSHVNATCGLHIHMSFKDLFHYMVLMSSGYQASIVDYLTRWAEAEGLPPNHPIWERLAGRSRYCQHLYIADAQARLERKAYDQNVPVHRYTAINYSHGTHGTIECRLLPMFDTAAMALKALKEVLAITNAFLVSAARREDYNVLVQVDSDIDLKELKESA
jgi:hypothetical protein